MPREINTIPEAEQALNELLTLQAQIQKEEAEANESIAEIRKSFTAATKTTAEKVKKLENLLKTFAEEHKDDKDIFPAGLKTLELNAGKIALRTGAESVTQLDGWKSKDTVQAAIELGGVWKKILKDPEPELDKTAVKRLVDEEKIERKELKKVGLKLEAKESVIIEAYDVNAYAG